ncbi:MAG: hypothetical protein AAF415_10100 [Pseudomonadota bacterium]
MRKLYFFTIGLIFALAFGPVWADNKDRCDWPAFERPCEVPGGIYRAVAPSGPGPHKTVVYLYGSTGLSRDIADSAFFQQIVDRFGYALVVPAARDVNYVGGIRGTGWSLRHGGGPRNDVRFLKEVIKDAEFRFALDTENILFMGQSRGGHLIWELACHNPEIGSAFAVHAGGYVGPLPDRCVRPVKFLHTHGTKDKIVRMAGMKNHSGRHDLAPTRAALAMLERTNNCDPRSEKPTGRTRSFERYSWSGCERGSALEFLLHRGGHNYPAEWFQVVIDWFEDVNSGPGALPLADPTARGKSIRFKGAGERSRFQKAKPEG